jgi:REP element-mobilizing transposase RayT
MLLSVLGEVVGRLGWVVHAMCLMDNHYHLLIETPEGNLSSGMCQINGLYTQRFNRRHARAGHVFQGRFKAILVERDSYLLELARYIVLNPVRAWWITPAATGGAVNGPRSTRQPRRHGLPLTGYSRGLRKRARLCRSAT